MKLLTREALILIGKQFQNEKGRYRLDEEVNKRKKRSSHRSEVKIFLSHKHNEFEELKDAIALLNSAGVSVYVDWQDEEMPSNTSGKTAARIKEKINENDKFILLATDGAISSKWCNWELGHGDAAKYIEHIAIIPVKEGTREWIGNEYLQIYPAIGLKNSYNKNEYEVQYPNGKTVNLKDWLSN